MKAVTYYDCGKCGRRFMDPSLAMRCEACHFAPTKIERVTWDGKQGLGKSPKYPNQIFVDGPDGPIPYNIGVDNSWEDIRKEE